MSENYVLGQSRRPVKLSSARVVTVPSVHGWKDALLQDLRWHKTIRCYQAMSFAALILIKPELRFRLRIFRGCILLASLLTLAGCAGLFGRSAEAPAVDLSAAGWHIWTGQAAWVRERDQPALAGDLLVAKNANGNVFVSFTKAALPLFTARTSVDGWWIDFVERGRSYSGAGSPPGRFIWFRVPDVLQGSDDIADWSVSWARDDEVILLNPRSGERIQMLIDL